MSAQQDVLDLIRHLRERANADEAVEPHAVLETDPITGAHQVYGSFPNRKQAVLAADVLTTRARRDHEEPYPTYSVCLFFTREQADL